MTKQKHSLARYALRALLLLIGAQLLFGVGWGVISSPVQTEIKVACGVAGVVFVFLIVVIIAVRRSQYGGQDRGYDAGSPQPAPWEFTGAGWGSANQSYPTHQEASEDPKRGS